MLLNWVEVGPCWSKVGLKLAYVGSELAHISLNCVEVGPSCLPGWLMRAQVDFKLENPSPVGGALTGSIQRPLRVGGPCVGDWPALPKEEVSHPGEAPHEVSQYLHIILSGR